MHTHMQLSAMRQRTETLAAAATARPTRRRPNPLPLPLPSLPHGPLLLLSLLSLALLSLPLSSVHAQYAFPVPDTCPATRFDLASLSCVACPAHSVPDSAQPQRCRCQAGYVESDAGAMDVYSFTCVDCIGDEKAASRDRTQCMTCAPPAVLNNQTRECECPSGQVLVERSQGGSLLSGGKQCVACAPSTRVFPDIDPYTCRTCPDPLMSMNDEGECLCPTGYSNDGSNTACLLTSALIDARIAAYTASSASSMAFNDIRSSDSGSSYALSPRSAWIFTYFAAALTHCYHDMEAHACSALANFCVLQKYADSSTACQAFQYIQSHPKSAVKSYSQGFSPIGIRDGWYRGMPFLYESTGVLTASAQLLYQKVRLENTRSADNAATGTLQFQLFQYAFNGSFLGAVPLGSQLQLCGGDEKLLSNFLRFGTNYDNSCALNLTPFLALNSTMFYEMYIVDVGGKLFPLPVKVLNLRLGNGDTPNRDSKGNEIKNQYTNVLTRRFYLIDAVSGRESFGAAHPVVLSYLTRATLRVEMKGSSTSEIRPPLLVLEYGEREAVDVLDGAGKQFAEASFTTVYVKEDSGFWKAAQGLFGTAIALAVILVIRRLWVWQRKSGSEVLEINVVMFVRFLVYLYSSLGDLFFIMLCCLSFYCWLFYKGQQTVEYLLPLRDGREVDHLRQFVIICFVAKLADVLFKLWSQIQSDVFFIDWEKPKGGVEAHGVSDEESGGAASSSSSVSVWRKLFAANKWNDLQSVRLINVPFTLFFMIFLMEPGGLGLKYLATAQPSPGNLDSNAAPLHPILLFAVCTFFLLLLCFLQLLFAKQVTHRYFKDEVAQFVDLLCTSNISALIMDERQHGFYIHGKTVHPYADVSLEEMNAAIRAEEKNLTRARGLDVGGSASDTAAGSSTRDSFEFYATHAWRATYDDLYTRLLHKQSLHAARAVRSANRGHMDMASEVELGRRGATHGGVAGLGRGSGGSMSNQDALGTDSDALISATLLRASASLNAWLTSFINREPQFPFPYDYAQHDPIRKILGLPVALPPHAPCTLYDDPDYRFTGVLMCGMETDLILCLVLLYALCNVLFESILVATLVCYVVDKALCAFRAHWGQINIAKKTLLDERFLI